LESRKASILSSLSLTKSEIVNDKNAKFVFGDVLLLRKKPFMVNQFHTIAEVSLEEMKKLIKMWGIENNSNTTKANWLNTLTEQEYAKISENYVLFNELREAEKLGVPKYYLYKEQYPLFAVYENVCYVIMPTIEDWDDSTKMREYPFEDNNTYPLDDEYPHLRNK